MEKTKHDIKCGCGKKLYSVLLDSGITGKALELATRPRGRCLDCHAPKLAEAAKKAKKAAPSLAVRHEKRVKPVKDEKPAPAPVAPSVVEEPKDEKPAKPGKGK